MTNFNERYLKFAGKAESSFYDFHKEFEGFVPPTYELCQKGADLANQAYEETLKPHFLGLAKHYQNYADEKQAPEPKETQNQLFETPKKYRNSPTPYKNPMTHPHYLGDGWIG